MKTSNRVLSKIILVITLAVLCFTLSCQKQDVEADIAAIGKILDNYTLGMNTGNLDLWMSLYTDDTIKMAPDQPSAVGKEQLLASMKPLFDNFTMEMAIDLEQVEITGGYAFARCTFTASMTPKAKGEPISIDGKALSIFKRQADGSWKIYIDCWNSNVP